MTLARVPAQLAPGGGLGLVRAGGLVLREGPPLALRRVSSLCLDCDCAAGPCRALFLGYLLVLQGASPQKELPGSVALLMGCPAFFLLLYRVQKQLGKSLIEPAVGERRI